MSSPELALLAQGLSLSKGVLTCAMALIGLLTSATAIYTILAIREFKAKIEKPIRVLNHSQRNHLSNVLAYAELIRDTPGLDASTQTAASKIIAHTESATNLLSAFISLSSSNKISRINPAPAIDAVPILARTINSNRPHAEAKSIALKTDLPPRPIRCLAGEQSLAIVLDNLLGNAIKYTPPGGQISTTVTIDNGHFILRVTDTGCGIPADEREKIFELGVRGSNSLWTSGDGLGLAYVKSALEQHGGTCRCEPNDGPGTTFTVMLPLA